MEASEFVRMLANDKGLSRLGDSFVNLVYSSAKTRAGGKPFGGRVPDKVLSRSLLISGVRVPPRLNHGERGDIVEGALAYAWSRNLISLEEAILVVERSLGRVGCESRTMEYEASAHAFSELFLMAVNRVCGKQGVF